MSPDSEAVPPEPVRLFYELFDLRRAAAGDFDELFREHTTPGFELRLPVKYPDLEDLSGVEAVGALFAMFEEIWEDWRQEPESWAMSGEDCVVFTTLVARGRGSGAEVTTPYAHLWRLRGGRAASVDVIERDAALEASGTAREELRPWPGKHSGRPPADR